MHCFLKDLQQQIIKPMKYQFKLFALLVFVYVGRSQAQKLPFNILLSPGLVQNYIGIEAGRGPVKVVGTFQKLIVPNLEMEGYHDFEDKRIHAEINEWSFGLNPNSNGYSKFHAATIGLGVEKTLKNKNTIHAIGSIGKANLQSIKTYTLGENIPDDAIHRGGPGILTQIQVGLRTKLTKNILIDHEIVFRNLEYTGEIKYQNSFYASSFGYKYSRLNYKNNYAANSIYRIQIVLQF